jgi:hypothetical protein
VNVLDLPSYEDFVGLWLNLERADWRLAGCVKRGVEMALGRGDLPKAYFDAMCLDEESTESMEWDENSARHIAQHFQSRKM